MEIFDRENVDKLLKFVKFIPHQSFVLYNIIIILSWKSEYLYLHV